MKTWTDENTGRTIHQLTDDSFGTALWYFRFPRDLPDGRFLARGRPRDADAATSGDETVADATPAASVLVAIDPQTGDATPTTHKFHWPLRVRQTDGLAWFLDYDNDALWSAVLPDGECKRVADLPADLTPIVRDITCDGRTLICLHREDDRESLTRPDTGRPEDFFAYVSRPRCSRILAYDLASGQRTTLVETEGLGADHVDASPTDPTLIRFCHDSFEVLNQRIWSVRIDGTDPWKIRPQQPGEMTLHEFWWPTGDLIGYKYQDRRDDPDVQTIPFAEYSRMPTRLGLADLSGCEQYLSDPINHYHTHLYRSEDGKLISGEGTHDQPYVYAAPFDIASTQIDLAPLATTHRHYKAFSGSQINCGFTADGRWLIYNDTIDGRTQVCAVGTDA